MVCADCPEILCHHAPNDTNCQSVRWSTTPTLRAPLFLTSANSPGKAYLQLQPATTTCLPAAHRAPQHTAVSPASGDNRKLTESGSKTKMKGDENFPISTKAPPPNSLMQAPWPPT